MNKKDNNIKSLLNEYEEKIKRLEDKQRKMDEKQHNIDKKIEKQNKKNKMVNFIMIFLFIFISGITGVASYTMGASSVEYTAKDSNWHVENTQEAIDDLYNSLGSSLVGSVYSYMGTSAPFGYLACDGSIYNIEDYPRLANHINRSFGSYNYFGGDGETTFAVPDLRGEFLRGTGTNTHTSQGSGATVGTHQDSTTISLANGYDNQIRTIRGTPYTNADTIKYNLAFNWIGGNVYAGDNSAFTISPRPTNTSVLYIIKY